MDLTKYCRVSNVKMNILNTPFLYTHKLSVIGIGVLSYVYVDCTKVS